MTWEDESSNPSSVDDPIDDVDQHSFPPKPLTSEYIAGIVTDWCDASHYTALAEGPCAICGELISLSLLLRVAFNSIDHSMLIRDGVQPVHGKPALFSSAVYDVNGCSYIDGCKTCLNAIKSKRIPKRALANGLWVRDVPAVLRDLMFVEKMVISRYRHNACVVEVKQGNGLPGQQKMRANAIIFPQPVGKVYDELPPPRSELEAILAILFVGPCIPVEPDFRRTPLLVRHQVVAEALTWLMANHTDYAGSMFSYTNLLTYSESEPPVCVLHRTTDGLRTADTMAVFDSDEEEGTSEGPCDFIVHGLSADELVDMSYEAKVAYALKHFDMGMPMLAFSHGETPSSMYHNPSLYPGLFPWLFPYGLRGFENSNIITRLSRAEHIRHLLMYTDRRFQIDEYFPLIVFNQEQIHGSNRGGYLLTKHVNFESVANNI